MSEESIVSVEAFLLASEEYCAFIERADQIGRPELLHGVHCRLADVYAAALRLPEVRSGLPPRVENLSADASSILGQVRGDRLGKAIEAPHRGC